ncbi:DUF6197 family protein [Rhodococcus sp. NPDC003994]
MTATPTTPADALNAAADLIAERGWTHGVVRDRDGRLCVIGALRTAVFGSVDVGTDDPVPAGARTLYNKARWALIDQTDGQDPVDWNDNPYRTAYDVTTALRAAAIAAR